LVNHFHPVGSDTPAARAAAGYCRPSAISTQNRRRTSRRTGGDPSDPSFGRLAFPDLIRHRTSINSVLRRLLEFGPLNQLLVVQPVVSVDPSFQGLTP